MNKLDLNQKQSLSLIKMTVDELVNETAVDTFKSNSFEGYQRKINDTQCKRIAESIITNGFDLPTAIICSRRGDNDKTLFVVDGQHRIAAFRWLKDNNYEEYARIFNCELPVVVMNNPTLETEIDTFVTINKTAKKVDTSLALVLKSTINARNKGNDLTMPRAEYLAVELAKKVSVDSDVYSLWYGKISFEGPISHKEQTISLNSFVRSYRRVISSLANYGWCHLKWDNDNEFNHLLKRIESLFNFFWECIVHKWPSLFVEDSSYNRIILGPIGVGAFSHFFVRFINERKPSLDTIEIEIANIIGDINIDPDKWNPRGYYSLFTSESGYNFVANELWGSV